LAVSQIVADTVEELGMSFPKPSVDLSDIRRKYHAAVREENNKEKGKAGRQEKSAKRTTRPGSLQGTAPGFHLIVLSQGFFKKNCNFLKIIV
jgi:hypothetical protein